MPKFPIPSERLIEVYTPMRVKFKDIFDMRGFYKALREYLNEHDWHSIEDKKDYWETYYYEKIQQSGAREFWIRWRCVKEPVDAPYLKYFIDFDWHCVGIKETEIIKDGKKIKLNKGEIEIYLKAYIEEEYKKGFQKNPFLKAFQKIFATRLYSDNTDLRKKELYQESYAMQNFIKQWFKLKRYLPYEEYSTFFPSKAFPSHLKES